MPKPKARAPGSTSLCKPSSVTLPGRPGSGGDHSSKGGGCPPSQAAYPQARASHPQPGASLSGRPGCLPMRPCSRWGLPCHPRCRGRGGLLPRRFTLTAGSRSERRRFVFCGTLLSVAATGRYPAPCSSELGLSSRCHDSSSDDRPSGVDDGQDAPAGGIAQEESRMPYLARLPTKARAATKGATTKP